MPRFEPRGFSKPYQDFWIFGSLAGAVGLWLWRPASYISEDSYFYNVIARNLALSGEQTFNGLYSTNGIHPLWLYLLSGYSWLVSLIQPNLLYRPGYAVPLSAGLLILGALNFRAVAERLNLNPIYFVIPPLLFLTSLGVLYSEAHAYYFTLSWLTRSALGNARSKPWGPVYLGGVAALVFLSRLDSIFFLGAFYLWYLVTEKKLGRVLVSGLVFSLLAGSYLLSNLLFFGGAVPISGWLKSRFPALAVGTFQYFGPLNMSWSGYSLPFGAVPIALSLLVIIVRRRAVSGSRTLLYAFWAGAFLHFAQVALFTTGFTQWYWYYVLPVLTLTLAASIFLTEIPSWKALPLLVAPVLVLPALFMNFSNRQGFTTSNPRYDNLNYARNHRIEQAVIMTSEWPGKIAFFTRNHIIAADMLTANRFFFEQMRQSGNALQFLLDYCRQQGKPVQYIMYVGGNFLAPTPDYQTLIYFDPKGPPRTVRIGEVKVGNPILNSPNLAVWKLSP